MIAAGLMLTGLLTGFASHGAAGPVSVEKGKTAVVYFSWSPDGNTRFAAETIAGKLGAKTFEVKAEKPYSSNYRKCCDEAKPECYGKKLRPILPIKGLNLKDYDVIFVGTPNWWGTMAPPIRTWLTENAAALKGKTVCVFQTNGGGGMQRVAKEFSELVPDSKILPAQDFSGRTVRNDVGKLERFAAERVTVK